MAELLASLFPLPYRASNPRPAHHMQRPPKKPRRIWQRLGGVGELRGRGRGTWSGWRRGFRFVVAGAGRGG